jgi:hypothetical protein
MSRRRNGFSVLEILVGFCALALVAACLMPFVSSLRVALNKGNQIADATRAASTALEALKGELADSLAFNTIYGQVELRPAVRTLERDINKRKFSVTLTISRAPSPLYALKARARTVWSGTHKVELGVLLPGPSEFL